MAFPSSGGFDYWAGGRALVTLAKDTGNLDYWLGGKPIAVGAPAAVFIPIVGRGPGMSLAEPGGGLVGGAR